MSRTIRTFFEPDSETGDFLIGLDETESNHLLKVLRLNKGDLVEALDGQGGIYFTEIYNLDRKKTQLKILDQKFVPRERPQFRMAVAMPKGNRWEDMIRPLTELGVAQMTPILSERSEYQYTDKKMQTKFQKWKRIAIDACKQSGNPWLPTFDLPEKFSSFLQNIEIGETVLFGTLSESSRASKKIKCKNENKLTVLIGPEGGWSDDEEKKSIQCGLFPFSLGTHALRVENAAVVGLAVARERFIL